MVGVVAFFTSPIGMAIGVGAAALGYYIYRQLQVEDEILYWSSGPSCCPPGSEPALSTDYKSAGEEVVVDGLPIYSSGKGNKVVIMFHDIFGWKSGRHREICDQFAAQGFRVVLPDLFHGKGIGKFTQNIVSMLFRTPRILMFVRGFPWTRLAKDIHGVLLPWLEREGATSIGCIGFCYGTWVIFHLSGESDKIRCGVNCHPSLGLAGLMGEKLDPIVDQVRCPQLLLPAGNDPANVKTGGDVIKQLKTKSFGGDCDVEEYLSMKHGWVTRGNLRDKHTAAEVKRALTSAISFFNKHL